MKKIIFLALIASVLAISLDVEFANFVQKYNKNYSSGEYSTKKANYIASKQRIEELNRIAAENGYDTKYTINKFSDLTPSEFDQFYKGYKKPSKDSNEKKTQSTLAVDLSAIPSSFDWRPKGAVSPIKNQGQCGSCWAFSATEGMESAWFLSKGELPILAPQQLVDCSWLDLGCQGGTLDEAFRYLESYGLDTEESYPYVSGESGDWSGSCQYNSKNVGATMTSWQYATDSYNETQMQVVMMEKGPLSICVDAETWQDYNGGIVEAACSDTLDHCVQLVGWNIATYQNGTSVPYWIVKNSWGTDWGVNGFIYVERNHDLCGIADDAAYVIV